MNYIMSAIRWTFAIIGLIIAAALFGGYLGTFYGNNMSSNVSLNNGGSGNITPKQETPPPNTQLTLNTPSSNTHLTLNTPSSNTQNIVK